MPRKGLKDMGSQTMPSTICEGSFSFSFSFTKARSLLAQALSAASESARQTAFRPVLKKYAVLANKIEFLAFARKSRLIRAPDCLAKRNRNKQA